MGTKVQQIGSEDIECIVGAGGHLGFGSYGVVRLGFHQIYGTVAVKCSVMVGSIIKKNELQQKIKDEIELVERAHHNNIVRVYGWTQWPGAVGIVMEHLLGGNLLTLLTKSEVTLEPLLRLRMCYEIANAIAFLHNLLPLKRLVHGDIKAENILLSENLTCKLADFGGARLSHYTGGSTAANFNQRANQFTRLYASPEVLEHPWKTLKPSHDTYSFSVTTYAVIGRWLPSLTNPQLDIYLDNVRRGDRLEFTNINNYIQELKEEGRNEDVHIITILKNVIEECWKHDPLKRPLMVDVKNLLHNLLSNQDPIRIQEYAVQAARQMRIKNVTYDQTKCVPIHKFKAPYFDSIEGEAESNIFPGFAEKILERVRSNLSLHEPSGDVSSETSSTPASASAQLPHKTAIPITPEPSPESQLLKQNIEVVKEMLKTDEMKQAKAQCQQLMKVVLSNVSSDCNVIMHDVIYIATIFVKSKQNVFSLQLIQWVMELLKNIHEPEAKLKEVERFFVTIQHIANALRKIRLMTTIRLNCIPMLQELLKQVESVHCDDDSYKTALRAQINNSIASCNTENYPREERRNFPLPESGDVSTETPFTPTSASAQPPHETAIPIIPEPPPAEKTNVLDKPTGDVSTETPSTSTSAQPPETAIPITPEPPPVEQDNVVLDKPTGDGTTESTFTTSQPSYKTNTSEPPSELQHLKQNIEVIKEMLKNGKMKEAETQCRQLIQLEVSKIVIDCDVITKDIIHIASTFVKSKHNEFSLKLIEWAIELLKNIDNPKKKLEEVEKFLVIVRDIEDNLRKCYMITTIKQECLPKLKVLLEQVESIRCDDNDCRILHVQVINSIALCYFDNTDYEQADEWFQVVIAYMQSSFGENYTKFKLVARSYLNWGLANYCMKKYKESESLYRKAIEIFDSITTYDNEEQKKTVIEQVNKHLRNTRSKLSQ